MWGRCSLEAAASLLLELLRASWISGAADDLSAFLLAAHLACLLLLILRFLGGTEERGAGDEPRVAMVDTSFLRLSLGMETWELRECKVARQGGGGAGS